MELDDELRALTDRQRAADAVAARRAEASLRRQVTESATLVGVLHDLAERQVLVAVGTVDRGLLRGVVRTIGIDFVSLRTPGVGASMVALAAISSVRTEPGAPTSAGDRAVTVVTSLGAVLSELSADRPSVSVTTVAGERFDGQLRAASAELITLRTGATTTYVPVDTISACSMP